MYQTHSNPILNDLMIEERHKDYLRATETGRLLALASGAPRRNRTLIGRTRHLLGAVLILVGTRLQGARRPERSERPSLEAPPTTAPSLS